MSSQTTVAVEINFGAIKFEDPALFQPWRNSTCTTFYDVNLFRVSDDTDLKMLLLQTTSKSIIIIEDLNRFMADKGYMSLSLFGVLNYK
ncbi:hypothetical protein Vadar_006070 [Vaccinium darrowii]|uniref:Uncharacterized protein n=1 Tax=Vaccinium darrowii TaxID=229202 RepID=A0ACB7ZHV2_9ERIC|nr:hypothetical protein Vadar_006070 [Vaccinium darrowii]